MREAFGADRGFSAESELTPPQKTTKGTRRIIRQWLSKRTLEEQTPPTTTSAGSGSKA